jgi:hypothetical protein
VQGLALVVRSHLVFLQQVCSLSQIGAAGKAHKVPEFIIASVSKRAGLWEAEPNEFHLPRGNDVHPKFLSLAAVPIRHPTHGCLGVLCVDSAEKDTFVGRPEDDDTIVKMLGDLASRVGAAIVTYGVDKPLKR